MQENYIEGGLDFFVKIVKFARGVGWPRGEHSSLNPRQRAVKSMDILSLLPVEISREVLSFLSPRDLGSCAQVSASWRSLVDCPLLWKQLCRRFGWEDTEFVDENRTHYSTSITRQGSSDELWILNKWALNFRIHFSLPQSWEKKRGREYLLSPRESPVIAFSCDEHLLALGHADGWVSVLDVWRVPKLEAMEVCLLPGFRVLAVQVSRSHLVLLQSMLLQLYVREDSGYRLVDAKSFELGYSMIEVLQRFEGTLDKFGEWYTPQIGVDKHSKEKMSTTIVFHTFRSIVYVAVRDYQMIYGWSLMNGKRLQTVHIPNRNCKLRDFVMHEGFMYIIYASRNIRHVTVYDTATETFLYELTTPECKTQKLIVGHYLIGIAIPGPGMTSDGVIKVWDKTSGKDVASRHTGYISFKTVTAVYDLVAYTEGTSVHLWEPKTNSVLKTLSVGEIVAFIEPCPYRFLMIVGNGSSWLWDWATASKLYRIYPQVVKSGDYRSLLYADQTMIILKVGDSILEMIAYC